jgi:hypothetical protein
VRILKNNEITKNAFKLAEKIINKTGPRLAGDTSTHQAADIINENLSDFTDKSEIEEFFFHQGAFLGWIKILVVSYILGVLFLWLNLPLLSLILAVLSITILVLQFFFYLPIIDKLYPKKVGKNVIGVINPEKEVKRQVIISGHHDSARVFNFFVHQPKLYSLRTTGSIAFVILLSILALVMLLWTNPTFLLIVKIIMTISTLLIAQMWFFAGKTGTPGAGDNLIASTMAVEIGRYFSQNKLKNTRIIIASFDAEEEGLRGARAYAKAHSEDLKAYPTKLLNSDCIYTLDDIFFLTSDINGTVKMDENLANDLVESGAEMGYKFKTKPFAFLAGGSDAGELAKKGVSATTLIGMPWSNNSRSSVYHTPNDTLEHVEEKAVEAAISTYINYIKKND